MQWKLTLSPELREEQRREILKKHFMTKEPFSKVSIHEMYVGEFVDSMLESGMEIRIRTDEKEVICLPSMD